MRFITALWLLVTVLATCGTSHRVHSSPQDDEAEDLKRVLMVLSADYPDNKTIGIEPVKAVRLVVNGFLDRILCEEQGLSHTECTLCFTPEIAIQILSLNTSSSGVIQVKSLRQLSVVLLNHVLNFRNVCKSGGSNINQGCNNYIDCRDEARKTIMEGNLANETTEVFSLEGIENVLRAIKAVYEPGQGEQCFSAESTLKELNITDLYSGFSTNMLEQLCGVFIRHLIEGECIDVGEAIADFVEDLFLRYGDKKSNVITYNGLQQLFKDLNIGSADKHAEGGHSHGSSGHDHPLYFSVGNNSVQTISHPSTYYFYDHGHHEPPGASHSDDKHHNANGDRKNNTTAIVDIVRRNITATSRDDLHLHEDGGHHMHRQKRNAKDKFMPWKGFSDVFSAANHEHKSLASMCWSSEELLDKFSQKSKGTITRSEFMQLCPALVQQVVSRVCDNVEVKKTKLTKTELYGYSSLAVLVISLSSVIGVLLIPILAKQIYQYVMMGFVGLSFGTMAGDAMLHLLPQVLGLHSHDTESSHSHENSSPLEEIPIYLWHMVGALGAVYGIFLFESIMEVVSGQKHEGGHGHSHVPDKLPDQLTLKTLNKKKAANKTESRQNLASLTPVAHSHDIEDPKAENKEVMFKSKSLCWGMSSFALVVTLGDTIHNIADGLAVGAAFTTGLQGGLSTSLAVLCHELPHEVGDFVVLLSTGLRLKKALLINLFSAFSAFIGLYIGINLGEDDLTRSWILTATAGIFLYVALADMLPELKQNKGDRPIVMFIVKNIGILVGMVFMMFVAIYEDHITF